jgi:integrase
MQKILDACPDIETRAWIAIARYAGLRCNSEISQLKWSDVNWERKSLTVRSPKTEGKAGHAVRIVPISKELQPIVMDLFEQAEEGAVDMVPLAKQSAPRLYQRFGRIVDRAGLTRWPRLLQNLRSSCATDWASIYPVHESSKWMGQSVTIASKHYLQSQDLHFKAVTGSGPWVTSSTKERGAKSDALEVQNRVQRLSAPTRSETINRLQLPANHHLGSS